MLNGDGFFFRASSKQRTRLERELGGAGGSVLSNGAAGVSEANTEGSVTVGFTMNRTAVRSRTTKSSPASRMTREAVVDSIGSNERAVFGPVW